VWLVPRSARLNAVGVEPTGSKCYLKNLVCIRMIVLEANFCDGNTSQGIHVDRKMVVPENI